MADQTSRLSPRSGVLHTAASGVAETVAVGLTSLLRTCPYFEGMDRAVGESLIPAR